MSSFARNASFSVDEFLSNYWQEKPIVIRNFFSGFKDPLESEELAGIALETDVESRLVSSDPQGRYILQQGPFQEEDFLALPERNWTLLVQAVDQIVPGVSRIKAAFDFLPSWRIDDVMVSHAAPGGGVGPHLDHYDVFLLQGTGRRRWKLGGRLTEERQEITESGLKLLKEFEVEQEVSLDCGDVLYIPPGYPHWGTAELAGLCYSIGFRAPSQAELVEVLSDLIIDEENDFLRYRDPQLASTARPGEISTVGLNSAWSRLRAAMERPDLFRQGFGELVTHPRYPEQVQPPLQPLTEAQLNTLLTTDTHLLRNPGSRFAWIAGDSEVFLFVDGECHVQPSDNLQAVISLCDLTIENIREIGIVKQQECWQQLLLDLVNRGSLFLADGG